MYDHIHKRQVNKVTEVIDLFDHKKSFGLGRSDIIRVGATGGLLDGKPIICGGAKYTRMGQGGKYGILQDMYSADSSEVNTEYMIVQRAYSASVILNINKFTTNLWVTGGHDRRECGQKASEFVVIRDALELDTENQPWEIKQLDSIEGPDLPFAICQHGMVKIKENAIYIIGGRQNDNISSDVWIVDPTNNYTVTKGPSLKTSRYEVSCGTPSIILL